MKNNKITEKDKGLLINFFIVLLFLSISFIFLLKSPLHIWNEATAATDSSVFKTVALMMEKGKIPYRDTFDHKGPLIYILNWLGLQISYYKGLFVIEFAFLFITLVALYKIARLKCKKSISIILTLLSISLLFTYFEGGNLTEEYAMPFIAVSLYIFLDYFLNKKINRFRIIICGFCFGGVLLLRPNMISVWIVFCIATFIKCLKEKKFKDLINFILFFIIGITSIIVPVLLWLGINGALHAFWQDYIVFNKIYSSSEEAGVTFGKQWKTFIYFLNNPVTILSFIITIFLWSIKKEKIYVIYLAYMILTISFICISGRTYNHYGMIIVPMLTFPFMSLYEELSNKSIKVNTLQMIVTLYLLVVFILPNWLDLIQYIPEKFEKRNEPKIHNTVKVISQIIQENTEDSDKISVYGNWNIIYVITKREHATKYSYQFPIGKVLPSIMDEYLVSLKEEMPKIIVIEKGRYDDNICTFLENNNYSLTWNENQSEDLAESALVFKKE